MKRKKRGEERSGGFKDEAAAHALDLTVPAIGRPSWQRQGRRTKEAEKKQDEPAFRQQENQGGHLLRFVLLRHPTPSQRLLSSDQQARLHSGGSLAPNTPGFSSSVKPENSGGAMPRFPR